MLTPHTKKLTPHIKKVLVALVSLKRESGEIPTIREITERCGFKSNTATTDAMKRLIDQGYAEKIPQKSRGLIITKKGYWHGKDSDTN